MCAYIYIWRGASRWFFHGCFEGWDAFTLDNSLDPRSPISVSLERERERHLSSPLVRTEKRNKRVEFVYSDWLHGHRDAAFRFSPPISNFHGRDPLEEAWVGKTVTTRFFFFFLSIDADDGRWRESRVGEREREREGERKKVERSASNGFEGIGKIVCRD